MAREKNVARSDPRSVIHRIRFGLRLFRYAVYLLIAAMLWWLFSNYAFVALEPDDASVTGVSGYRRLLVERFDGGEPFKRGEALVFAMLDASDRQIFRISRVQGVPGDRLDGANGLYTVNGRVTEFKLTEAFPLPKVIDEGFYFVVNDNRLSPFADSRRLGLIPEHCVIGLFLAEMPF